MCSYRSAAKHEQNTTNLGSKSFHKSIVNQAGVCGQAIILPEIVVCPVERGSNFLALSQNREYPISINPERSGKSGAV